MIIVEIINGLKSRAGAEVFVVNLSCELAKNDNDQIYLISLFDGIDNSFKKSIFESRVKMFSLKKKKGFDLKAAKKLKQILKRINPDIIHLHLSCLPTYFIAFGFSRKQWKLFETIHSIPGSTCKGKNEMLRKVFIRKKMITFIGITNEITRLAKIRYKKIECETIYNGVVLKMPKIKTLSDKHYDLIIVASFTEAKNHSLLFKVIKKINEKYSVSLICIGDGPLKSKFLQESTSNVAIIGAVDNVYDYLLDASAFVLSSIREGNPISILEAMDCGLPIIAPSVGGIPDIIKNGENGLLYEPNNELELERAILYIKNNPNIVKTMSENNIIKIKKYSMQICAQQYHTLFQNKIMKEGN